MTSIEQNLTQYAAYHRDRRNIATHFVGVPMIVFAIVLALATVVIPVGGFPVTAAALVSLALCLYYFRLDLALGLAMAVVLFAMCAGASEMTHRMSTAAALGWAGAIFAAGWAIQFLGHRFEGMKPAFLDDAKQLLIGPLFVCAEAFFIAGTKPQLRRYIEDRVGPTVARRDGRPLPLHDFEGDTP
ncbi:MAG TPA: Mpo1-like protein [Usitatibacter sp.]|nr:Mpo1-like protein [Usitatibacter sp.]